MTVLKSELYEVINKKKSELCREYYAQERQIKTDAIDAYYEKAELDETLELFVKQLQEIKKTAAILESTIPSYNTPIRAVEIIEWFDDVEALKQHLYRNVWWNGDPKVFTPEVKELDYNNEQEWNSRRAEFDRLTATIKANSPTKGYKLLKELGFDVSHLDPSSKPKASVPIVLDFDTTKLGVSE
ncbi:hypothetical protein HMH09_002877 [Listeria monocytogenes]|nr:hypothetical protein [Listeria monocytogenes]